MRMSRIVISDPEEGKAYQVEPEESQVQNLFGMKVGDSFEGDEIGLTNYELKITGGSDREGFPSRPDVRGRGRTRALLAGGTGYNPTKEGERQRKSVRGSTISENITQINVVIEKKGDQPIEQALGLEPAEEIGGGEEAGGAEGAESEEGEPEEEPEEEESKGEETAETEEDGGDSESQKESEEES